MDLLLRSRLIVLVVSAALACGLAACAGSSPAPPSPLSSAPGPRDSAAWPQSLPQDQRQPWELGRSLSALDAASGFTAGAERFNEAGDVTDLGQASRLQSGAPGAGELSYALYRIAPGGQPGALAADINLRARSDGSLSTYYLGLSDYSAGRWQWLGPYTEHNLRLGRLPGQLAGSNYLSPLGNLFVAVVAFDGSRCDVLGLTVDARDPGDATALPAPSGLTATAVAGGIALQWNGVIGADLAGYCVYHAHQTITSLTRPDVQRESLLEGTTRCIITTDPDMAFVRVTAVDASGNESAPSAEVFCQPLEGAAPQVWLDLGFPAVERDTEVQLAVQGDSGLTYDYDLDGNGVFEITGSGVTTQAVDTSKTGLIRARVRAVDTGGTRQFLGGVSLIVSGNTPPVAVATASPQTGAAPLEVTFTGADSTDFDGSVVGGGWDFDGDGTYELFDDTDIVHVIEGVHSYTEPGLYNAKLRVLDDQGAWDVDTVSIFVQSAPGNLPPQITGVAANPSLAGPETTVNFSFAAVDADGTLSQIAWDFDNDGTTDSTDQVPDHVFGDPGLYNVKLTVTDDGGAVDTDFVVVSVQNNPANLPPVITSWTVAPSSGPAPLDADFTFAATDADGSVANYELDYENDGVFDFNSGAAGNVPHTYNAAGLYNACLRVTDSGGATSRSYLGVQATTNIPPVALLSAAPSTVLLGKVLAPLAPVLNAAGSYDPEGGSLEFAFDADGDGSFTAYSASSSLTAPVSTPGIFQAAVKVRDGAGDESLAHCQYTVKRLSPAVLESNIMMTGSVSITALQGDISSRRLGIAYYDASGNDDLRFMASADQVGASWLPSYVVDTGGGQWASLAQDTAQFNLAYYRDGNLYFKASQNDGQSFNVSATIDGSGDDSGNYCSCAIVNGRPAVAYYNATDTDLFYSRATNSSGSAWGIPVFVDTTGEVGQYCSLLVISGAPCIAYYRADTGDLMFVRAANADGTSWNAPITVNNDADDVGKFTSLAYIGGAPMLAYFNDTDNILLLNRSVDSLGLGWSTPIVVATSMQLQAISLRTSNNRACIFASQSSSDALYFSVATDDLGTDWPLMRLIEGDNAGALMTATVLTNGLPAAAYYDAVAQELHFAAPRLE